MQLTLAPEIRAFRDRFRRFVHDHLDDELRRDAARLESALGRLERLTAGPASGDGQLAADPDHRRRPSAARLAGGTGEVQKGIVARLVLGL